MIDEKKLNVLLQYLLKSFSNNDIYGVDIATKQIHSYVHNRDEWWASRIKALDMSAFGKSIYQHACRQGGKKAYSELMEKADGVMEWKTTQKSQHQKI